jgi:hypothetical protein
MADRQEIVRAESYPKSLVLYCLIRRWDPDGGPIRFLLIEKGSPTFPPTKFRPGEDLYQALVRPMEQDLGLPPGSYFPELELEMIPASGESVRYPGVTREWNLYPVDISLTPEGHARLACAPVATYWWTLDEVPRSRWTPTPKRLPPPSGKRRTEWPILFCFCPRKPRPGGVSRLIGQTSTHAEGTEF